MDPTRPNWQRKLLVKVTRHLPVERLLDVGCRDGSFLDVAEELGIRAIGVDLAPPRPDPRIRVGDFLEMKFGWVDLVTAWDVIEHIWDLRKFVAQVRQVSSVFLISTPDAAYINAFTHSFDHVCLFTSGPLRRLLAGQFQSGVVVRYVRRSLQWGESGMLIALATERLFPMAFPRRLGEWTYQGAWTWDK